MKVSIGTPCHSTVEPDFMRSVIETLGLLRERGHQASWGFVQSTWTHQARNIIAAAQLRMGSDVLVQADADQQWNALELVNAIECVGAGRAHIVGFPISSRLPEARELVSPKLLAADESLPVSPPRTPLRGFTHEGARYVEVRWVGGLTVCSRACVEKLSATAKRNKEHPILYDFVTQSDGAYVGQDVFFTESWRAAGGKVHCHIDARIGHIGRTNYTVGDFASAVLALPIEWADDGAAHADAAQ